MKKLFACLCTLWVAGVFANDLTQPGSLKSLPIGSREAVIAQLEKEVDHLSYSVDTPTSPRWYGGGKDYSLATSGPIVDALKTNLPRVLNTEYITPADAGASCAFRVRLVVDLPGIENLDFMLGSEEDVYFTPSFEGETLVVPEPEHFIKYPFAVEWLPVTGALEGVERVDYIIRDPQYADPDYPDSEIIRWSKTVNGVYSGCLLEAMYTNKVLYLCMKYIEPEMLATNNYYGEVRLWYSVANGLYESFDVRTGQKIASILLLQAQGRANGNGAFCVDILGIPGYSVRMETSADLKTWSDTGDTIALDNQGKGSYQPSTTGKNQAFFRARLLPTP